ncbi:MAG: PAS domain S-box protein, partial [Acidobacteria bacterium]|nr:PAS domain S-box protein [Acidobacteriota bacterium]
MKKEIDERRKTERALQESEARFRTLVENAPEIILVLDADTGRFVDFNENAVRFFGLDRESLLKVGPIELSPPNLSPKNSTDPLGKIQEALDGGTPAFEWIHRNAAGEDIHCEVRLMRLPAAGRNLVRGSITNISDQKRAEAALRRYAKRLEILQEIDRAILAAGSPEAIAQAALSHIRQLIPYLRASVMVWNEKAAAGALCAVQSAREVKLGIGARLPLEAFGGDAVRQGQVHMVKDVLELSSAPYIEALKAEGLRSWINVPLISQGELIGTLNLGWANAGAVAAEHVDIAREVADSLAIAIQQARLHEQVQHHAAELEQRVAERTAELEAFSYSVSHDLRTPLLTIDGFSKMLLEEHSRKLDTEAKRLLSVICTNVQNMGLLIDDLLAFSRLGRQEMRPAEINMGELAGAVFEDLKSLASDRQVKFKLKELPPAFGDQTMMRQVFVNLLSNALKFARSREVAVIEVGAAVEGDENVYHVKDNGVGFDMKYASKLFGVFQRLHTDEEFAGTGVG